MNKGAIMNATNTYLAVFTGSKTSPRRAEWDALPEAQRRAKEQEGIAAWKAWAEKHQAVIVTIGGPLGKTKKVSAEGITDISNQLGNDKVKGYVIDLRNNPGGLLDQAISVSDAFLERGEIVSTRGRDPEETQRFSARPGDLTKGKPVIVLINGGSASASEIVAGALQDHRRATLVGTRSFGKGSVQTIIPLGSGNGALRLTTARYFTPSGRSIQAKGVTPDIEVLQDVPEELKARTSTTSESTLKGHLKAAEGQEETGSQSYIPPDPKNDKALNTALDLVRGIQKNSAYPPNPKATPN